MYGLLIFSIAVEGIGRRIVLGRPRPRPTLFLCPTCTDTHIRMYLQVRRLAAEAGLCTAAKRESMGICFVGKRRYVRCTHARRQASACLLIFSKFTRPSIHPSTTALPLCVR